MEEQENELTLTDSLEDYLETIYQLVREKKFARVKDIARARNVRPGSVSPAMRRLAEMGLIEYVRREYIGLTPEGERRARRVLARHQILCRLFEDILSMPSDAAEQEACVMEHSLSDDAMDRLVRFFEFLGMCPEAHSILERFHKCGAIHEDRQLCDTHCALESGFKDLTANETIRLDELAPFERGRVTQVSGHGSTRSRVLDMGIMPDIEIEVARIDKSENTILIKLQGFEVTLSLDEAETISLIKV